MNAVVVVPLHTGAAHIAACLRALLVQQDVAFSTIVVENGSADEGAEIVARSFAQVELLRFAEPLGFAGACNRGITLALERGVDAVVLLNQDTEVDPGFLDALLRPLENDPAVGISGAVARFPDGRIQHAGAQLVQPAGYGRNLAYGAAELPRDLPPPDYMAFAAAALRGTMLRAIGILDEGFNPAYFEDADLCLRAVAAGWRLHLARDATLVHHEGAAANTSYRHAALIERNRLRLALKHRAVDDLTGAFYAAEHAQMLRRALEGSAQVLRQAYGRALIDLPDIAAQRGMSATDQGRLAALLALLRDEAGTRERVSRMIGLRRLNVSGEEGSKLQVAGGRWPVECGNVERGNVEISVNNLQPSTSSLQPSTSNLQPSTPVTIIILTWNGLEYTRRCIESIRAHTRNVEYHLLVVDNGSSDGTLEWLREQQDITLIANERNLGFTRGNNQGLAATPPDHDVLLLNNDTLIIQDHWLAHLRDVANSRRDIGIAGCTLLHANGLLQHAGTYMPGDSFWGHQVGGGETYVGQYPGVREVEGITGACMYIRREVRAAIGGLDEAYVSYFEDTDYCLRARQAGFKVVCTGGTQVVHYENTSSRINNAAWRAMWDAGRETFVRRWGAYYKHKYDRAVVWHSLVASPSGYATSSRELVVELDRRGIDVRLACIWGNDYTEPLTGDPRIDQLRSRPKDARLPQVVYHQGDSFIKNSGRYRIGFTMLEADRLPDEWVYQANQMDEVWTPTHWGADVFRASGVRRPVHVVPLGINPDYFHPGITGRKPAGRYVFLSVFEWIERKAPELLIRAYLRSFRRSDDVVLLLKVFNHDATLDVARRVKELAHGDGPPIVLLSNQTIAAHQLGCLYRSADCFVLPTRGEGWGMPALEAMACGLPVISTAWGAQTEFLHPGIAYPLQVRGLVPAEARSPYYRGLRWADPDEEHLCALMRHVYEHPDEARAVGERAALDVAARWTWAQAASVIEARLRTLD